MAAGRTGAAFLLGMALGLLYGFLRPLRPKYTLPADCLFVLAATVGWVYLAFGICRGDPRLGQWAAVILGGVAWELTAGRLLRGIFRGFWKILGRVRSWILLPFKKFFDFLRRFVKNHLHLGKNRVQ